MTTYRRQDVLRIFEMSSRQLQAWERAGLIPQQEIYSFQDLGQLRILCALRAEDVSAASIRDSVLAMKAVSGMANPLLETRVVRTGTRLAFRHHGAMVDPIRGQFLFDFERGSQQAIAAVAAEPSPLRRPAPAGPRALQELFLAAVHAEEAAEKQRAISLYEEILTLDPDYAAACINLGTIYFHLRQHGREGAKGLHAGIPVLVIRASGNLSCGGAALILQPAIRFHHLGRIGRSRQNLRHQIIGIERDGRH